MEVALPVGGHPSGRAGDRLVQRMVLRGASVGPSEELLVGVVPEPRLARLVAADQPGGRGPGVGGGVLGRRGVAAPDVPAPGAPAEVEPPAPRLGALVAPGAAGGGTRIDVGVGAHGPSVVPRGDASGHPGRPRS